MAIATGNKIVASEINANSGTTLGQYNIIYATDIAAIYGGSDTVAKGEYIRAEHYQNLGLPGTGGLNGIYQGYTFVKAVEAGLMSYTYDSNGWILLFELTGSSTLNFTSFGKYGAATDIFMIGGGGAGNKNGLGGSGGFYSTTSNKTLATATNYTLSIGTGGTSNGTAGGGTSAFSVSVNGGYGGKAHTVSSYYRGFVTSDYHTYYYETSGSVEVDGERYREVSYKEQIQSGDTVYLSCDENGSCESHILYESGQLIYGCYRGEHGGFYRISGGSWQTVQGDYTAATRPTDEMAATTIFDTSTTVGGAGSNTSAANATRKGQGGGGTNVYGGSSFGTGGNGLIAIRNHR